MSNKVDNGYLNCGEKNCLTKIHIDNWEYNPKHYFCDRHLDGWYQSKMDTLESKRRNNERRND